METADTGAELRLYPARIKVFLLGVVSGLVTVVCATGVVYGIGHRQGLWLPVIIVSLFLALACGYAALYYVAKAMLRKPAVELSLAGITDRTMGLGTVFIPWEQVAFMECYTRRGSQLASHAWIGIVLRDAHTFAAQQPPFLRWLMAMGGTFGGYPININLAVLSPVPNNVWARINTYLAQHETDYRPVMDNNPHDSARRRE